MEQNNHRAAHMLAPPSHFLQLSPGWVPVPWSPHFVRSGLRITGATHWEAAGRPASLLLVQRFPDFVLSGITRGALKTPAAQVAALVTESEQRSQASVVVIDPLLIPCAAKYGHQVWATPCVSLLFWAIFTSESAWGDAGRKDVQTLLQAFGLCLSGWVGQSGHSLSPFLLTSPLLLLPN